MKSLAEQVVALYTQAQYTLATAESLTAGGISATVADIPGASQMLLGGVVAYHARIKKALLGVTEQTIQQQGVVSEQCAMEMATGARERLQADVAVSVTGVAGPTGGTADTPVGTVYIGVCTQTRCYAKRFCFVGTRQEVREQTVQQALQQALCVITDRMEE